MRDAGLSERHKAILWWAGLLATLAGVAWLCRDFRWPVVWQSAPFLLRGLGISWLLTLVSVGIGMVAGIALAAARLAAPPGLRHLAVG